MTIIHKALYLPTPYKKVIISQSPARKNAPNTALWTKRRRGKLKVAVFIGVLLAFILILLPQVIAENKGIEDVEKELGKNVEDKLGELNLSELEDYYNNLEDGSLSTWGSVKSFVGRVIKGDFEGGYNDFFKASISGLGKSALDTLPSLLSIIAIAILFSILSNMSSNFVHKSTNEIIYFVCFAAIAVILLSKVVSLIVLTNNTIKGMQRLMELLFPIMLTLITSLGGVITVSAYQPMMAVVSTSVVGVITAFILPCFIATVVLSVVGNLSPSIKLDKLNKFFKSTGEVVLGIMFSLFMTFVTLQGITGAIADSISVKSAKFAISSYVPILGGYLSEGFDLILASIVLIKNSLGLAGVIIMLTVILMPVLKITVFTLGLKLVAGIIEPIGDKRMSDFIATLGSNMRMLIVAILAVSFMFFIMIMLVIYTCNMGV